MLDARGMDRLTKDLDTKSEKMRALAKAGCQTAEIARYLDVRYQFVRNVLLREKEKRTGANAQARSASPATESPNRTKLDADGWVRIPEGAVAKLGLKPGETLTVTVDDGEIRLMTIPTAVRKAQAIVRQYVPEGVSLVDELLEDRRREVERERQE